MKGKEELKDMAGSMKHGAMTWGSFAVFVALEVLVVYHLCKFAGVI